MSKDLLYVAEFSNGYPFRAVIDFLKSTITEARLVFSKKGIYIKEEAKLQTFFIDIFFDPNKIGNYQYNSDKAREAFGFVLDHMKITTTTFGKKDSFKMWRDVGDDGVSIQKINQRLNNNCVLSRDHIVCKNIECDEEYDLPEYTNPICTIPSNVFSEMCKSMAATKCSKVKLVGYGGGVIFESVSENDISKRQYKFGQTDGPQVLSICVMTNTIKALSKVNNFGSEDSIVNIFIEEDRPVCISSKIGNFGNMRVLLRDVE